MGIFSTLLSYWWVLIPILSLLLYKSILRILFGMVIVPENRIGLVTKKFLLFGKKSLPAGRIIASDGEAGYQIDPLAPGLHWGLWIWQYQVTLQEFITIPKGKIGLVTAKDGSQLPTGQILARSVLCDNYQDARAFLKNGGQKGKQTNYLNTGIYRINTLLFSVEPVDITVIGEGQVGIITAQDGLPLNEGQIAGTQVAGHNNFQDFDTFLKNGGQRGLQTQTILAGSYTLNPWAVSVECVPMTEITIGNVGVVTSYVGEDGQDMTGSDFKHGNIVKNGQKGIWLTPLDPGKYAINPYTTKLQIVPTTNLVLNWANARSEAHNLDKNLSTITVRSKDGFTFNLDVSQIIHIPASEAPKVIARFGSIQNLVSQVLEPTIGNYFRNSAQDSDVISFLSSRVERQDAAKQRISQVLTEYNVHAVDTLIGDITPPDALMKTLTDRKIAQEEEKTYGTQIEAQKVKQKLASETALADMQPEIVKAQQSVQIAEKMADASVKKAAGDAKSVELKAGGDATAIKLRADATAYETQQLGQAEAGKIEKIGNATATAYKQQVDAMGADNFAKFKIFEEIGKNGTKIIPDIMMNGGEGGSNPLAGLATIEMLGYLQKKHEQQPTDVKAEVVAKK
jgi:uncharacterized membrane protein YqiK